MYLSLCAASFIRGAGDAGGPAGCQQMPRAVRLLHGSRDGKSTHANGQPLKRVSSSLAHEQIQWHLSRQDKAGCG